MNLFVISSFVIFVFCFLSETFYAFFFLNLLDNEWRVCSLLRRKKVEGDSGVHSIGRCSCLAVGSCSKWKWTDRPPLYVSQYLPCTHSSRPSNPVTFVTLYLRHACSFAQHLFPHNAISLSISLPTYVELLTQYPIYHGGCYMMALLTSFRLCQKEKRKKGLGFPWRMFDLGCEIKRWEYIQQRHNAEHFRTSRKKPNTTQKKIHPWNGQTYGGKLNAAGEEAENDATKTGIPNFWKKIKIKHKSGGL